MNVDLPNIPESYVHRIGRTARAGKDGIAISFCDTEERAFLKDIERTIGQRVPVMELPPETPRIATPAHQRPATPQRRPQPHQKPRAEGRRPEGRRQEESRTEGHRGGHGQQPTNHGQPRRQKPPRAAARQRSPASRCRSSRAHSPVSELSRPSCVVCGLGGVYDPAQTILGTHPVSKTAAIFAAALCSLPLARADVLTGAAPIWRYFTRCPRYPPTHRTIRSAGSVRDARCRKPVIDNRPSRRVWRRFCRQGSRCRDLPSWTALGKSALRRTATFSWLKPKPERSWSCARPTVRRNRPRPRHSRPASTVRSESRSTRRQTRNMSMSQTKIRSFAFPISAAT